MLCKNCKKEIPDKTNFCKYCGEKVEHKKSEDKNEKSELEKKVESIIKKEFENIFNLFRRNYILLIGVGVFTYSFLRIITDTLEHYGGWRLGNLSNYADFSVLGAIMLALGILNKLKENN